jgi:hypothetical protein
MKLQWLPSLALSNYSTWMADSIISRGQGIAPADPDSSIYLQIGIVQKALLGLLNSPEVSHCDGKDYRNYVQKGSESILGRLLNASQDTLYPLDRLSLGRGLLMEYVDSEHNQTVDAALDSLHESIELQPRNQYGNNFLDSF